MGLTNLIFRDTIRIRADYGTLVAFFKGKLNETYFEGFIDRDETQLFYFSDFFSRAFSPSLPVIQLNFKKQTDSNGEIEIKLVNFVLILFGLANGLIILFSLYHIDSDEINAIPLPASIFILVFSYGFLLFFYRSALAGFKKNIENLTMRQ